MLMLGLQQLPKLILSNVKDLFNELEITKYLLNPIQILQILDTKSAKHPITTKYRQPWVHRLRTTDLVAHPICPKYFLK